MTYGLPYIGSKNRIARDIIDVLPSGERLVDLFAGGCAITHCAMLSGKWRTYLVNDIDESIPQLFLTAIRGEYKDETRWISREDFFALKDTDAFVRTCWSFGNKGQTYIYGKPIEPYKRACHFAILFNEWTEFSKLCPEVVDAAKRALDGIPTTNWQMRKERRLRFGPSIIAEMKRIGDYELTQSNPLYRSMKWDKKGIANKHNFIFESQIQLDRLNSLESLQSCERLDRLNALQSLQSEERVERLCSLEGGGGYASVLSTSALPYEQVDIQEGDVVYADPPYANTGATYGVEFDHARFWEWCATRDFPVYISEYDAPDGFVEVMSKEKIRLGKGGNSAKNGKALEKVYLYEKWAKKPSGEKNFNPPLRKNFREGRVGERESDAKILRNAIFHAKKFPKNNEKTLNPAQEGRV